MTTVSHVIIRCSKEAFIREMMVCASNLDENGSTSPPHVRGWDSHAIAGPGSSLSDRASFLVLPTVAWSAEQKTNLESRIWTYCKSRTRLTIASLHSVQSAPTAHVSPFGSTSSFVQPEHALQLWSGCPCSEYPWLENKMLGGDLLRCRKHTLLWLSNLRDWTRLLQEYH